MLHCVGLSAIPYTPHLATVYGVIEMLSQEEKSLLKLSRLMELFRSTLDETVPIQLVHTFLVAARNEGKGVVELSELVGTNKSTMSRHLLDLADRLRNKQPGYGVLERKTGGQDLRAVTYKVTHKGRLILSQATALLEG